MSVILIVIITAVVASTPVTYYLYQHTNVIDNITKFIKRDSKPIDNSIVENVEKDSSDLDDLSERSDMEPDNIGLDNFQVSNVNYHYEIRKSDRKSYSKNECIINLREYKEEINDDAAATSIFFNIDFDLKNLLEYKEKIYASVSLPQIDDIEFTFKPIELNPNETTNINLEVMLDGNLVKYLEEDICISDYLEIAVYDYDDFLNQDLTKKLFKEKIEIPNQTSAVNNLETDSFGDEKAIQKEDEQVTNVQSTVFNGDTYYSKYKFPDSDQLNYEHESYEWYLENESPENWTSLITTHKISTTGRGENSDFNITPEGYAQNVVSSHANSGTVIIETSIIDQSEDLDMIDKNNIPYLLVYGYYLPHGNNIKIELSINKIAYTTDGYVGSYVFSQKIDFETEEELINYLESSEFLDLRAETILAKFP